ncbi:MAG: hypothetical protein RSF40_04965 [Oscillospiraceae bacterium]
MKFQSKYNIGDTVTLEQENGKSKVLITEINATNISGREVEISYVGETTTTINFCESAITGIVFLVDNAEQASKISNGIYIYKANGALVPLSDAKKDKTALGVVLVTDYARIFIDKDEQMTTDKREATTYYGWQHFYFNPMRLPNPHEWLEITFNRDKINEAMNIIGGMVIRQSAYWTRRGDFLRSMPDLDSDIGDPPLDDENTYLRSRFVRNFEDNRSK